jgi:hypothetical protein
MQRFDRHIQPPSRYGRANARRPMESGFSALELLVIVVIVCAVAAIGIPVLHAQARASVLEQNFQTLVELVTGDIMDGYSIEYRSSGEGDPNVYLSTHLEETLGGLGKDGFVNPVAGTAYGRTIVNTNTVTTVPLPESPAVLITDSPEYRFLAFNELPETERRMLAGSLVVVFLAETGSVELFYVDHEGVRSDDVVDCLVD